MAGRTEPRRRIRIGAVRYLNTKPLVYDLPRLAPWGELSFDHPSRLADALAEGELDVALIPSIEFFRDPTYTIVSDACIACDGPVMSVKLFFRRPVSAVRTLALDAGSRTSAALAQILLADQLDHPPAIELLPADASLADTSADAVLLIGDRAIHSPAGRFADVWDLGDAWTRRHGLPFVFAMWVARAGGDLGDVELALAEARDLGLARLEAIADAEAPPLGLTRPQCLTYLRDYLRFRLGPRERRGLELFYQRAAALDLLPRGLKLDFARRQTAR
jgi:chorismate dehydratase